MQRKRGWKNSFNQRKKNSFQKFLNKQDSQTRMDLVNASGRNRSATLTKDTFYWLARIFDKLRSVEGSRLLRVIPVRTQIGPVMDTFSLRVSRLDAHGNYGTDWITNGGK